MQQWNRRSKADCFKIPQGSIRKENGQQQQLLQQPHHPKKTLVIPQINLIISLFHMKFHL